MGSSKPPKVSRRRRGDSLTGRAGRRRDVTLVSHSRQRSLELGLGRGHARESCLQCIFFASPLQSRRPPAGEGKAWLGTVDARLQKCWLDISSSDLID
jgi:hypothetical protein